MSDHYYDATADDFEKELVGRKIVAIAEQTLELDDGTLLVMEDTESCCAFFGVGRIKAISGVQDNVITSVTSRDLPDSDYGEGFVIVVLSAAKELVTIEIDGTASNGYYCHSINLSVRR